MSYFVYILYSPSTNSFYKGQTHDLAARITRHNNGWEKFTSVGKPWILLWYTSKPNRTEALALEKKLKNLSRQKTIELMLKYDHEVAGPDELLLLKQLSGC